MTELLRPVSVTACKLPSSPEELLRRCAVCWERPATTALRSAGGWNVSVCDECYPRHEIEPALTPVPNSRAERSQ